MFIRVKADQTGFAVDGLQLVNATNITSVRSYGKDLSIIKTTDGQEITVSEDFMQLSNRLLAGDVNPV